MNRFQVDSVSRVQAVLGLEHPNRQIIRISAVEDVAPVQVQGLPEFPDVQVSDGTRVYQVFQGGVVFEICVLRG